MKILLRSNIVTRNLREWMTLALVIFGFIYLTGDAKDTSREEARYSTTAQFVLESSDSNEPVSNDVSGSDHPVKHSYEFLVEANFIGKFGSTDKKLDRTNSQYVNHSPHNKLRYVTDSKNTLSLVDSDLAHQFTLLGEKPSGTS